jgi:phosphoserine phosphatase
LLRLATEAVAVNPTRKMRQLAMKFDIVIEDWR